MKKTLLLTLALFSISTFASEKLNCWVESKDIKTNKIVRNEKFKIVAADGIETKVGDLYGSEFFVLVEQKGDYPEITILSKDSNGKTYSATSSQLGGIENGGIKSACTGTAWYNRECMDASEETGAVGCSLARNLKF